MTTAFPPYACEDCGWPWPLPGRPPESAECGNCGGKPVNQAPAWRKGDKDPERGNPVRHPRNKALLLLKDASPEVMRSALLALIDRDPLPVLTALAGATEVAEPMERARKPHPMWQDEPRPLTDIEHRRWATARNAGHSPAQPCEVEGCNSPAAPCKCGNSHCPGHPHVP